MLSNVIIYLTKGVDRMASRIIQKCIACRLFRTIDFKMAFFSCLAFGIIVFAARAICKDTYFFFVELLLLFLCILIVSRFLVARTEEHQALQAEETPAGSNPQNIVNNPYSSSIMQHLRASSDTCQQIEEMIFNDLMFTFLEQAQKTEASIEMIEDYLNKLHSLSEKEDSITDKLSSAVKLLSECNIKLDNNAQEILAITDGFITLKNQSLQLQEGSSNILSLLEYIRSIARDTQLLSLNASIEAARSDNSGKGFIVIAEEIKKLSESTKSSIDSIKNNLEGFIKALNIVVKQIDFQFEAISAKAQEYKEITSSAKDSINQVKIIAASVSDVKDEILNEINKSKDVYDKISSLSQNFDTMSNITDKILEKNSQVQKDLGELAESLDKPLDSAFIA